MQTLCRYAFRATCVMCGCKRVVHWVRMCLLCVRRERVCVWWVLAFFKIKTNLHGKERELSSFLLNKLVQVGESRKLPTAHSEYGTPVLLLKGKSWCRKRKHTSATYRCRCFSCLSATGIAICNQLCKGISVSVRKNVLCTCIVHELLEVFTRWAKNLCLFEPFLCTGKRCGRSYTKEDRKQNEGVRALHGCNCSTLQCAKPKKPLFSLPWQYPNAFSTIVVDPMLIRYIGMWWRQLSSLKSPDEMKHDFALAQCSVNFYCCISWFSKKKTFLL